MYNIPILGIIGEDFTLNMLIQHLANAKDHTDIMLLIGSDGGFCEESEKMKGLLVGSGKTLHSSNIGNVASAASELFTVPPIENRTFDIKKGLFLIHNPWGEIKGDAEHLGDAAGVLKKVEDALAKHYQKATGADLSLINALMRENKPLTVEQIESLGFSKIKSEVEFKAVAKINTNTNMEVKDAEEKISKLEKAMATLTKLFTAKSLVLADASGTELEFPDVTAEEEIVTGTKVLVSGAPAGGTYVMPSGVTVVAEAGEVVTVTAKESEDAEAMKAENEALKAENAELKASATKTTEENEAIKTQVVELNKEVVAVKALFSTGQVQNIATPPKGDEGEVKFSIKNKKG